MRIGIDAKCFVGSFTGVGNYCYNLLKELVLIRPDDEFYLFAHKDFDLDLEKLNKVVSKGLISNSGILWLMARGPSLVKRHNIDVYWATTGLIPVGLKGVKTVINIYDFVWRRYPATMPFLFRTALSMFTKSSIHHADKIVTISKSTGDEILSYYGRVPDKIIRPAVSSIYHKRSMTEVLAIKAKYNINACYNLIVGTLEPRKNLDTFLRAYSDVAESSVVGDLPILVIVGGKGWGNSGLLNRLQSLAIRGLVRQLGYVPEEDLPALYTGASLFFMPSFYEGFGMPVLEAYSCATPVVASDIPALHEACCDLALFHEPTYEGIRAALEQIFRGEAAPPQPDTSLVHWSWQSGAKKLSQAIDEAAAMD
jgi:glycosyltransferase involved in cell wall biosynthesis